MAHCTQYRVQCGGRSRQVTIAWPVWLYCALYPGLEDNTATSNPSRTLLLQLAGIALWLSIAEFGAGYAIIQQLKRIVVHRYQWVSEAAFPELFAVATALPGTAATNLLAIIGVRYVGFAGGVLSAVLFVLPSVAVMIAFGTSYSHFRNCASLATFLDGMSLATIGVVAGVAADIGRCSLKRPFDWVLALFSAIVLLAHVLTLVEVMALAALCGAVFMRPHNMPGNASQRRLDNSLFHASPLLGLSVVTLSASPLLVLLIVFARVGMAAFGGGFAMIPAIEHESSLLVIGLAKLHSTTRLSSHKLPQARSLLRPRLSATV
jgi:chromate transporter